MAKTLATFRLEETDWKDFHDWARSQGSTATMELSRFVLGKLGKLDVPTSLDSNQLDTKLDALIDSKLEARLKDIQLLDDRNIDDRIATLIDNKLDKRIDEKLSNVDLAIAKLPTQEDGPPERIDEVISQLGEKEIIPILSRAEMTKEIFDQIKDQMNEETKKFLAKMRHPDLETKIRDYINMHQGQDIPVSNFFKSLDIVGNKDKQIIAKQIFEKLGCTRTKIASGSGNITGWKLPTNSV